MTLVIQCYYDCIQYLLDANLQRSTYVSLSYSRYGRFQFLHLFRRWRVVQMLLFFSVKLNSFSMHKLVLFLLQGIVLIISMSVFVGSVLALGAIVSAKPLDDLRYKGLNGDPKVLGSPYTSYVFLGWAMASAIGLVVTSVLPIISWFATYRFSLSSAIFIGLFAGILSVFISPHILPT